MNRFLVEHNLYDLEVAPRFFRFEIDSCTVDHTGAALVFLEAQATRSQTSWPDLSTRLTSKIQQIRANRPLGHHAWTHYI